MTTLELKRRRVSTIKPVLFLSTTCQKRMTRASPWLVTAKIREEENTRAELAVKNNGVDLKLSS